jgi:hypothetical protein
MNSADIADPTKDEDDGNDNNNNNKEKDTEKDKESTKPPHSDKSRAKYEDDPENFNPFQKSEDFCFESSFSS